MFNRITAAQRDNIITAAPLLGFHVATETLTETATINDTDEDEAANPSAFYTLSVKGEAARVPLLALIIAAGVDIQPDLLEDMTTEAAYSAMVEYGDSRPYYYDHDDGGICYALRIADPRPSHKYTPEAPRS